MQKAFYLILFCTVLTLTMGCTGKQTNGAVSEDDIVATAQADYKLGSEYDKQKKLRLAEMYYKKAYEALKDTPEKDWKCYARSGYSYAYLLNLRGEMDQALNITSDILSVAAGTTEFPPIQETGLLELMAGCQRQLGMLQEAKQNMLKSYGITVKAAGGEGKGDLNVIISCINMYNTIVSTQEYEEAESWLRRSEEEFHIFEQEGDTAVNNEYGGIISLLWASHLQITGHPKEAAQVYDSIPSNSFTYPNVLSYGLIYLMNSGRYAEAADMYNRIDSTYASADSSLFTLDAINDMLRLRYLANRFAGRTAEALSFADKSFDALGPALNWQKKNDAAELAVIYQTHEKELELNKAQAETRIHRILLIAATLIILLICFLLWRLYIHNKELTAKNRRLLEDIEQREREEKQTIEQMKALPEETLTANQKLFRRICELMDSPDRIYTDMALDRGRLAQLLGTNEHYVTDAISACSGGKSVNSFLNEYRLRYAAHLLATTNDSVALIAELSGFARSSFFRIFSDAYGMSPSEYRKVAG